MLLQDQEVTWDLRSSFYGGWPWVVSLMVAATAIGLGIYIKLQKSRRKFTASSHSSK